MSTNFPGMDMGSLQALMQQFAPSEEDKRQARAMAAIQMAAGLLGTRRGQEGQGIGNAISGGLLGYQNDLRNVGQQRMQGIQGASAMMDLAQKQQAYKDMQAQHAAAAANLQPGMPPMGPPTAQGDMQPAVPPTQNWQGYQNAIAGTNPQMAMQLDPFVRRQLMREAQSGVPNASGPPPQPYAASTGAAFGLPPGSAPPSPVGKGNATQQFIAEQMQLIKAYRAKGLDQEANELQQKLIGMLPQSKAENLIVRGPDGKPTYAIADTQGNITPTTMAPAEKLHFANVGNQIIPLDQYSGTQAGAGFGISQSPDSKASNAVTMRGQNLTNARAMENIDLKKIEMDPMGIMGVNQKGMASGNATPVQAGIASGLHGEEFLKTLPEPVGNYVRNMIEGKQPYPGAFAMKSPQIQQYVLLASQADPSFDATTWAARQATRKDATSGKMALQITALNTAMDHASSLADSMGKLNNFGGVATPLNAPVNAVQQAFGDPRQKQVQLDTLALSHELAKVFRQTGMSDREVKEWEDSLSRNMSPTQQKAAISEAMKLMNGRIEALGQQYGQGMGKSQDGLQLLSPRARASFEKLRALGGDSTGASGWTITEIK